MHGSDGTKAGSEQSDTRGVRRRRALRYLGGGALAATLGTAGCVQQAGDGGGSTATDADDDT
jgi:hypothetical protein